MESLETFAQTGKVMAESITKMKNSDINLKAKRSKAKVKFGLELFDGR